MKIKAVCSDNRKRLYYRNLPDNEFVGKIHRDLPIIAVDTTKKFQTHLGFGGAITESVGYVLSKLDEDKKDKIIADCFSEKGLNYNLCRLSVHSSDFGLGNYVHVKNGDINTFDISHEKTYVLPALKKAQEYAKGLTVFATSWSPPAYMKTNGEMNYGGKLKKEFYGQYAEYLCRYVEEMQKQGVKIDVMSAQNEPEAVQVWDSCVFSAEEEADFLENYFIPALKSRKLETKLILWDHNRDRVARRCAVSFESESLRKQVWGVGYHWYVSPASENLSVVKCLYPEKHILLTEACVELTDTALNSVIDGKSDWEHAERYAKNIINDFNNYSEGFIDWNIVLDGRGGPNHVGNFCEAPIMVDIDSQKITYNPSYYALGHFSKFIKPMAKRVLCVNDEKSELSSVAYLNPNGNVIIVILNTGWVKETAVFVDGKTFNLTVPDSSITTVIIEE